MTNRETTKQEIKTDFNSHGVAKGDTYYYARVMPTIGYFEILELKIRTVDEKFFCGTEKHTKQAYLFGYNALNTTVFKDRKEALKMVKDAEKNSKVKRESEETYDGESY